MPNRIVREGILTSAAVDKLSSGAELFYRRLLNVADDFGRYHASPVLLRSAVFPLKIDTVLDKHVEGWLKECSDAGLVTVYITAGQAYLQIAKFGEPRAKKSKFPAPPTSENICLQTQADDNNRSQTQANVPPFALRLSDSPTPIGAHASDKPKRPVREKVNPTTATIPDDLGKYEDAIRQFVAWRDETLRKPVYAGSWDKFLDGCRKLGVQLQDAIDQSMANGWQGLFAPKRGAFVQQEDKSW